MAWMESLAKRQGASAEEFTTSADVDIAEIDPDSVVIDEPGYIPPEGSRAAKEAANAPKPEPKPAAPAKPAPAPAPEPIQPAAQLSMPMPAAAVPAPAPAHPVAPPPPVASTPPPGPAKPAPAPEPEPEPELTGLSWLESLAADSSSLGELDLSGLGMELTPSAEPTPATNPINWLEDLASAAAESAVVSDDMNWLESLAKRQGARTEELTTDANLQVPLPDGIDFDGPGYSDYALESGPVKAPDAPAPPRDLFKAVTESKDEMPQDPSSWLDSLAAESGFHPAIPEEPVEVESLDDNVLEALNRGDNIDPKMMEQFFNRQFDKAESRTDAPPDFVEEDLIPDPDAEPVRAELPDWLIDQIGDPVNTAEIVSPTVADPNFFDTILEGAEIVDAPDLPDWLNPDNEVASTSEVDDIFAPVTPATQSVNTVPVAADVPSSINLDPSDPWVEALELEYLQRDDVMASLPMAAAPVAAAPISSLPTETELPMGEVEPVPDWLRGAIASDAAGISEEAPLPDWLSGDLETAMPVPEAVTVVPVAPVPAVIVGDDVPAWLEGVDIEASDIPDWLKQSITSTSEEEAIITPAAASAPALVTVAPVVAPAPTPVRQYSPAPVPVSAQAIDVPTVLEQARSLTNVNNLDGSLRNYETLIRANVILDDVVGDLTKMTEKYKNNAAVFRVLGDGLMRQGKLQSALDIYRKALNQL